LHPRPFVMGCTASACGGVDLGINCDGERFRNKYQLGNKLGQGSFGIVREAFLLDDGSKFYAAKIVTRLTEGRDKRADKQQQLANLKKQLTEDQDDSANNMRRLSIKHLRTELADMTSRMTDVAIEKEIEIMRQCVHERICSLVDVFQSPTKYVLVLTRCYGRFERSKPWGGWEEDMVRGYFLDLCLALAFMHSKDIIHRDVKPENMMMDAEGRGVLCDLGFAVCVPEAQGNSVDIAGTRAYIAPEVWDCNQSKASDMWAAGCTLYWMAFDILPDVNLAQPVGGGSSKRLITKSDQQTGSVSKSLSAVLSWKGSARQSDKAERYRAPDWQEAQKAVEACFQPEALRKVRPYQDERSTGLISLCRSLLSLEADRRPTAQACVDDPLLKEA